MSELKIGRRRFAIGAAAAATATLIRPGVALGQGSAPSQPAAAGTGGTTLEQAAHAAMAKLQPPSTAEVEMKVSEILRKYGDKLSPEQKADIRKVMAENQDHLEEMRAFVLANSDQPATVFRPYRSERKS